MNEHHAADLLPGLADLLNDPAVGEIMVDRFDKIYVEKGGVLVDVPSPYESRQQLTDEILTAANALGRPLDGYNSMSDFRLPGGFRMNAVLPPIPVDGPTLTIRRFSLLTQPLSANDLLHFGSWDEDIVQFLEACVQARVNMAIAGGTGSGKTAVMQIIAGLIPDDERIIKVENASEISLPQPRVINLESRPADAEGQGEITIQDLVINALRMRPDRLIVGECRGPETLELLQAMNTGHDGSMFSIHAGGPRDVLARLETMSTMHSLTLPLMSVREMLAHALDLIVYIQRQRDGSRKVTHITEVLDFQGTHIQTADLFQFQQTGVDDDGAIQGYFTATGVIPHFMDRFRQARLDVPMNLFAPR